jgi:hypothetical protein
MASTLSEDWEALCDLSDWNPFETMDHSGGQRGKEGGEHTEQEVSRQSPDRRQPAEKKRPLPPFKVTRHCQKRQVERGVRPIEMKLAKQYGAQVRTAPPIPFVSLHARDS